MQKNPSTIETGVYVDTPILFIFFDQEAAGQLGSRVWIERYNIASLYQQGTILSLTAFDTTGTWQPHDVGYCLWAHLTVA